MYKFVASVFYSCFLLLLKDDEMSILEAIFWGVAGIWTVFAGLSFIIEQAEWNNRPGQYHKMYDAWIPAIGFWIMGIFMILASVGSIIRVVIKS